MSKIEQLFIKIGSIDRRWIFIIIALVVIIPLLVPIGMPIRPTDTSKAVYDAIEGLQVGSKVLVSFEYSPSTKPENCLLYTSPSPRDAHESRMPSSA